MFRFAMNNRTIPRMNRDEHGSHMIGPSANLEIAATFMSTLTRFPRSLFWQLLIVLHSAVAAAPNDAPFLYQPDTMVPMRDGTRLAANVFLPKEPGRYPTILMRTPYGKPDKHWDDAKR